MFEMQVNFPLILTLVRQAPLKLKMFKTDFNIEDYKKLMPELIKKMKIDTAK